MTMAVVLVVVGLVDSACPKRVARDLSGLRRHTTLTLTLTLLDLTAFDSKAFRILCYSVPDADIWSKGLPLPVDRAMPRSNFPLRLATSAFI